MATQLTVCIRVHSRDDTDWICFLQNKNTSTVEPRIWALSPPLLGVLLYSMDCQNHMKYEIYQITMQQKQSNRRG